MAYFPGYNDSQGVDLNTYAPTGVTFNVAQAVNDAGQILVLANAGERIQRQRRSVQVVPLDAGGHARALHPAAFWPRVWSDSWPTHGETKVEALPLADGSRVGRRCWDGRHTSVLAGFIPEHDNQ